MKLSRESVAGNHVIRAYGEGRVTVGEEVITRSVVVMPKRLVRDWPPQRIQDLALDHFASLAALEPEIVLLGTGRSLRFPPAKLIRPLVEAGIGLEVMDTPAACRTYNILAAEDRRVAAALLMI